MRLIDADALKERYYERMKELLRETDTADLSDNAISLLCGSSLITDAPTTYAVPVIRCKDCKWFHTVCECMWNYPEDYCSRAERKDGDMVEGLCCDCKKSDPPFYGDSDENIDCPYRTEDGSCWEAIELAITDPPHEYSKEESVELLKEYGVLTDDGEISEVYQGLIVRKDGDAND